MSTLNFTNEFPILRRTLDLGDYHPDLRDNSVEVWVNLSDAFQARWRTYNDDLKALIENKPDADLTDGLKQRRANLFAELWSLDVAEVVALFEESKAAGLRAWMRRRTWELIEEYATGRGEPSGVDPVVERD